MCMLQHLHLVLCRLRSFSVLESQPALAKLFSIPGGELSLAFA